MNHLIDQMDLGRIENSLLQRRNEIVQATSWTFNMVLLGLVLAGFGFFLYTQYNSHQVQEEEEKRIPFTPTTWSSATRNVRMEEYGRQLQPREAQIGHGIPESIGGDGFSSVYGDYTSRASRD